MDSQDNSSPRNMIDGDPESDLNTDDLFIDETASPVHESAEEEVKAQKEPIEESDDRSEIQAEEDQPGSPQQTNEDQLKRIQDLEAQIDVLKQQNNDKLQNEENLRKNLKEYQLELIRKENIFKMHLALKEQELQEVTRQNDALKLNRTPTSTSLASYLLDPAMNFMFEKMKKEVEDSKARVEEMQNDLNAWKFTPDSATGKRLMAKCSQLHQENEELGRMISSGKIAKLESSLAMHEKNSMDYKCKQAEIEEALLDMEEDIEGLQNTVYFLQQQLKEEKERNKELVEKTKSTSTEVQQTPSESMEASS